MPQSNITRQRALSNFSDALQAIGSGTVSLPPDVIADLPGLVLNYGSEYQAVDNNEAGTTAAIATKNTAVGRLRLVVLDFLKVLRLSINRSVVLGDGQFRATDGTFYNLDSTGGDLPLLLTDDEVEEWANSIVAGEANRLNTYPTSPAMTNPDVALVSTLLTAYQAAKSAATLADHNLSLARNKLNNRNPTVDAFIRRAWDFLEANFSHMEPPARRDVLRGFGVVYVSQGQPNTITYVLKDENNQPLVGAKAVLAETGAEAVSNPEGRLEMATNAVGTVHIENNFADRPKLILTTTIAEDLQGATIDLGVQIAPPAG